MTQIDKVRDLVDRSRTGDSDSLSALSQQVEGKIYAYIYRVTLDPDITEDLVQDTHVEMVSSIMKLKKVESFWPWLYRIARSKIQQHYRQAQRRKESRTATLEDALLVQCAQDYAIGGLGGLMRQELVQSIVQSMKGLKQEYRSVLALRCYEDLSYAEIASVMNCSELNARVWFFRARKALQKRLSSRGISKGAFLAALGLFGRATATVEAASATTLAAGVTQGVGTTATVVGMAGTKMGVVGLILTGGIMLGGLAHWQANSSARILDVQSRDQVKSVHFTVQSGSKPAMGSLQHKGAYEKSYYFPEGVDGPMFMRMQRWGGIPQTVKLCSWLQNAEGNYYFHSGERTVYLHNYNLWLSSWRVTQLPTDTTELARYLRQTEDEVEGVVKLYNYDTGMLESIIDARFRDVGRYKTSFAYNTLQEDYFLYDWPTDVQIVDLRDKMHQRGWTWFRIKGAIGENKIEGKGRIPFVYAKCREYPAWLQLEIENKGKLMDSKEGAYWYDIKNQRKEYYRAGTFFEGLFRPWMGLHTIDLVRRDAAARQIEFQTERAADDLSFGWVTLVKRYSNKQAEVSYMIDMERDLIDKIILSSVGSAEGGREIILRFSFLDEIDQENKDGEFTAPTGNDFSEEVQKKELQSLWLFDLIEGNLASQSR